MMGISWVFIALSISHHALLIRTYGCSDNDIPVDKDIMLWFIFRWNTQMSNFASAVQFSELWREYHTGTFNIKHDRYNGTIRTSNITDVITIITVINQKNFINGVSHGSKITYELYHDQVWRIDVFCIESCLENGISSSTNTKHITMNDWLMLNLRVNRAWYQFQCVTFFSQNPFLFVRISVKRHHYRGQG